MIRNSPARIPLWLAKRKWRLDGRKRGDGAYWRSLPRCYRIHCVPFQTLRSKWYWVARGRQSECFRDPYGASQ